MRKLSVEMISCQWQFTAMDL